MSTTPATSRTASPTPESGGLVPQPGRPQLPVRVPVSICVSGTTFAGDVLGSTSSVLLLERRPRIGVTAPLGAPVRVRVEWDRHVIDGRVAAHGAPGRILVSVGERAIRRSRRVPVDVPGVAGAAELDDTSVRVKDLSAGGARVEGIDLPMGSELTLQFTPPGQAAPISVRAFVARSVPRAAVPTVGVAFRMAQPGLDVLATATPS